MTLGRAHPPEAGARGAQPSGGRTQRHPVVIVGAGPTGLTAALDCAARGIDCLLIGGGDTAHPGPRAVCHGSRSLQIWGRLGVAAPLVGRGVAWQVGRVFFDSDLVSGFDLRPEPPHPGPAMVNLPPQHLDETLVQACQGQPRITLCWKHKLLGLRQAADHAVLTVQSPEGSYEAEAQWVIACDGAHSEVRALLGADFPGRVFEDHFLVTDVVMDAEFPAERWFWFDPPFHRGHSVLLHKVGEKLWRVGFQLGAQADPQLEVQPGRVIARLRAMLGDDKPFELESCSVHPRACRRIDHFRHGRVLFAGDAAHEVSHLDARGVDAGVQDIDNLAWKLKLVLDGQASDALVETYHEERAFAADEALRAATRLAEFIAPTSPASLRLRDAVLELAQTVPFARMLVDSGGPAAPNPYPDSPLNTPDEDDFAGPMAPGSPCVDAPVRVKGEAGGLLQHLGGGFVLLSFGAAPVAAVSFAGVPARVLTVGQDLLDETGLLGRRYDARPGTVVLVRPDQRVAARWRAFDAAKIESAIRRCLCA
ncbi:MAG: FAD-dependent monooxygenase [Rubrivivax sp.]|nr:FAD-dependent monooxygenase [Rubrivivax sp.]